MGIVGLCIVSNNGLESTVVLEEFGLRGHWICKNCSGSSSEGLPTGQESDKGYIEEECNVCSLLGLESG